jgi:hypothetical protein
VEHGLGNQSCITAAAETGLSGGAIHTALPGAENAVDIIHKNTSFGLMIAVFLLFHKHCFT